MAKALFMFQLLAGLVFLHAGTAVMGGNAFWPGLTLGAGAVLVAWALADLKDDR